MNFEKHHDISAKGNAIAKVDANSPRPHADGCVGCRRAGVCIQCGKPSTLADGRCISGACKACCPTVHRHVGNNPNDLAERIDSRP